QLRNGGPHTRKQFTKPIAQRLADTEDHLEDRDNDRDEDDRTPDAIEQDRVKAARPTRRLRLLEVAARADLAGPLAARGRILDDGQPRGAGTRQWELAELLQEVPDKVHAGSLRRADQRDRVTELMRERKRVDLA